MARLAIVEDQILFAELLSDLCVREFGHDVVFCTASGDEALQRLGEERVELLLLDLKLPDYDGPELAPKLRARAPSCRILAVSGETTPYMVHQALNARLHGFVDKGAPPAKLREAIDTVLEGNPFFTDFVISTHRQLGANPDAFTKILSPAELALMPIFGQGLTNEAIAEQRQLSASTVQTHRRNIMAKLGLHSSIDLMRYAIEQGFVSFKTAC